MSEIKSGDLVMVVHSCCGALVGTPFVVGYTLRPVSWRCDHCRERLVDPVIAANAVMVAGRLCHWPVSWLKKLDPPATGDEVSTRVPRTEDIRYRGEPSIALK